MPVQSKLCSGPAGNGAPVATTGNGLAFFLPLAKKETKESMPDEVTMNQMITAMVYEFERLNLPIPTGLISGISHQNRTKAAIEHNLRPFRRAADNLKKILAQNPDAFPAKITQRKRKAPVEKPAEAVTNEQVAKAEEQVDAEDELDTEDEIPFQAPVAKMMRTAEGKKAVYSHPQAE